MCGLIPAHAGKTVGDNLLVGATRAHPRSRGENSRSRCPCIASSGSSPLTRGKRSRGVAASRGLWLIPAHAGKTACRAHSTCVHRAHPRSRGENSMSCFSSAKFAGSSPLTRGKPARFFAFHTPHGLIPAHAGKTACERVLGVHGRAHPRSRGENGGVSGDALEVEGSSPLTRGKLSPSFHPPVK